jgi:Fur family transcriptional regulator, ferric uptake regulator
MTNLLEHRNTRQRQIILEEISKLCTHPTAEELYEIVRKRLPHISLGTVYRNLEFLARTGEIQEIGHSGSQKRFDPNTKNHHHVRCVLCDRVDDVTMDETKKLLGMSKNKTEYQILTYRLEYLGICPSCADTARKNRKRESVSR